MKQLTKLHSFIFTLKEKNNKKQSAAPGAIRKDLWQSGKFLLSLTAKDKLFGHLYRHAETPRQMTSCH